MSKLRIAVVHSYYSSRQPSGENVVVDLQVDALRRAGHEVLALSRLTDDLESSRLYPLAAGLRAATNRGADPCKEIDAFRPDVLHVHNLFPNYGRAWVRKYAPILVTTMHNYRPICPAATLFRDGGACTLCPDHQSARFAMKHACFKGSRVQTVPVALGTKFADDALLASAARIITLNEGMLERYAGFGVDRRRLVMIPNFVNAPEYTGDHAGDANGPFWLYVGRITSDKGVLPLVRDWPAGPRLLVVGTGPLEQEVRSAAGASVTLLGQQPPGEVRRLLATASGLFFPSLWPEGLPTVYLEALAAGLPVICSPHSIVADLVRSDGTGFVTTGSIPEDIARATSERTSTSARCREVYEQIYVEDAWVGRVEDVYREILAESSRAGDASS